MEIDENIDDPLYEKAISIVGTLNSNGVEASISRKSDRVVKVEIASRGFLCIYYKSKNRAFTITYNELKDKELAKKIELLLKTNKTRVIIRLNHSKRSSRNMRQRFVRNSAKLT